jgi:adenine-specific DNA-methyltransferase
MEDNELIHETPSHTPNFRTELARQLAELMPEVVADGKIDTAKLKELLAEDVADETERFGLFWPGKRRAMRAAQEPTTATLRPDKANSKDWDTTQNVFIEGDNLEVLKILQKHYHNRIKMIYIDPPYNTGSDFVYQDNFKEGVDAYLEWTRQVNNDGYEVSTNRERDGRYHTNWLNMMLPRLKLARNLLADDGAIFISIDDHEVAQLRKLCDEVFGESNFVASIVWKRKRGRDNSARWFSKAHEYALLYARNINLFDTNYLELDEGTKLAYKNPDQDTRGVWRMLACWARGTQGGVSYEYTSQSGQYFSKRLWLFSKESLARLDAEDKLVIRGDNIYRKLFLSENKGKIPETLWDNVSNAANAADEIKRLFDDRIVFDTSKPVPYISEMIKIATGREDIILDFFAGSSTTAQAVMQINSEDGGKRKFIMVQLPEPTPDGSEARKGGFSTIADISRKRIQLAGESVRQNAGLAGQDLDIGFRAFRLSETCFAKWQMSSDINPADLEEHLFSIRDSAKDDATPDDLLTELLLKQGHSLTERITTTEIAGLDTRVVGDNLVLAYLDEAVKPTLDQLRALVAEGPAKIIVLEDAFHGDDELKTNLAQLCESKGIELWTA